MGVIFTTEQFDTWHAGLRDARARAAIRVRMRRAEEGNFGDCAPGGDKSTQAKDVRMALKLAREI
jgi:putative component of toxin-antitoxin plasmid stabilization module